MVPGIPTACLAAAAGDGPSPNSGSNPPNGVMTFYNLSEELDEDGEFTLEYLESDGDVIKTFTNKKDKKSSEPTAETKKG